MIGAKLGATDIAEPIQILTPDEFAYELRRACAAFQIPRNSMMSTRLLVKRIPGRSNFYLTPSDSHS